jgi:hypothetical protein
MMLTIERYCNKCEERLTKSRSKGNNLMIFCGSQISTPSPWSSDI